MHDALAGTDSYACLQIASQAHRCDGQIPTAVHVLCHVTTCCFVSVNTLTVSPHDNAGTRWWAEGVAHPGQTDQQGCVIKRYSNKGTLWCMERDRCGTAKGVG